MTTLKKNESGFSTIEAVLLFVVIIAIAGVGWYVWKTKQNTTNRSSTTSVSKTTQAAKTKAKTAPVDPTAKWQTIQSPDASFSIKIPQNWVSLTCEKSGGGSSTVYIASSKTYLAKCNSDYVGEVYFYTVADQSASQAPTKGSTDQSISTEQVVISGISGYKATVLTSADDVFAPNTQFTNYSFYAKNTSFYGSYQQITNGPNDLATYEQIVQTWKF